MSKMAPTWVEIKEFLRLGKLEEAHHAFLQSGPEVSDTMYRDERGRRIGKRIENINKALGEKRYDHAADYAESLDEVLLPNEQEWFAEWWSWARAEVIERTVLPRVVRYLEKNDQSEVRLAYELIRPLDREGDYEAILSDQANLGSLPERIRDSIDRRRGELRHYGHKACLRALTEGRDPNDSTDQRDAAARRHTHERAADKKSDGSKSSTCRTEDDNLVEEEWLLQGKAGIRRIAESRGVEQLVHFTRYMNLHTILQYGILPKNEILRAGLCFAKNDGKRLDGRTDCSCLSISFPNHLMLAKYHKHRSRDYVILLLDPSILWEQTCYFFSTNAASSLARQQVESGNLSEPAAFLEMFKESDRFELSRQELTKPTQYTTDPQAEVLVPRTIPYSQIMAIIVENQLMVKRVRRFDPPMPVYVEPAFFEKPLPSVYLGISRIVETHRDCIGDEPTLKNEETATKEGAL